MALLEFLVLIFFSGLIIMAVLAHLDLLDTLTIFESSETRCPNCENSIEALPYGRHRCSRCNFVYDVGRLGRTKKYNKLKGKILRRLSKITFVLSIISFIMIFAPKPTFIIPLGLGSYDFIVYFVVFLILGGIFHNNANKISEGRAFYDNQLNDES